MVTFHSARHYPANNAIFAPQVLADYLTYKGDPAGFEYFLPLSTNSLNYTVIRGYGSLLGGMAVSDYLDVNYFGNALIAQGSEDFETKSYFSNKI